MTTLIDMQALVETYRPKISSEAFIILKHLHFMDLKEKRGVKRRQNLFI